MPNLNIFVFIPYQAKCEMMTFRFSGQAIFWGGESNSCPPQKQRLCCWGVSTHVWRQGWNLSRAFFYKNHFDCFLHEEMQAESAFAEGLSESSKAHLHLKDYCLLSQGCLPFHLSFSSGCSATSTSAFQTWRDYTPRTLDYYKQTLAFVINLQMVCNSWYYSLPSWTSLISLIYSVV